MKKVFISDCEGPISKNDNALELTSHFVPDGTRLFTVISQYDDVLAEVLRRRGYKAGDTLKLILPFLKACNATDKKMREFSAQNLLLIRHVKETLQHIRSIASAFIVSTSYQHYIEALCQTLEFPLENTYCTKLTINSYQITQNEKAILEKLAKEIAQTPLIEIPPSANSLEDFSEKDQSTIRRLDQIFWKEIASMNIGRIYSKVSPVGGSEKAKATKEIVQKLKLDLSDVMYVGDSITDVEAFKLVRERQGLTVAFNGNRYAVENAEIALLSENSLVTAVVADIFCKAGKDETMKLVEDWSREGLRRSPVDTVLLNCFFQLHPRQLPKVKIITSQNMQILAEESSEFRKKVRGEAVGGLG